MSLLGVLACRPDSAPPPRAPAENAPTQPSAAKASSASPVASAEAPRAPPPTPPADLPPEPKYELLSEGRSVDEKGCVRDLAKHAAEIALKKYRAEVRERLDHEPSLTDFNVPKCIYVEDLGDLDGDGEADSDVSTCYTGGNLTWTHFLYLSNRGCKKPVGELGWDEILALESKSHGVKDLEATSSNGCAGNDFVWEVLRFNGTRYRVVDKATCYLCDGEKPPPGSNRHPKCQRERAWRKADGRDIP